MTKPVKAVEELSSFYGVSSQLPKVERTNINQNQNRSIEAILIELYEIDTSMYKHRQITVFAIRLTAQDSHRKESEKKAESYLRTGGFNASVLSVVIAVTGGYLGGPQTLIGSMFQAASQGCDKLAEYKHKEAEADREGFTHHYQVINNQLQDLSRSANEYDQSFDRTIQKLENFLQSQQRLIESAAAN